VKKAGEELRAPIEHALCELGAARQTLDTLTTVRVQQALRRDESLSALLAPALSELAEIARAISNARTQFRVAWDAGQVRRWVDDDRDNG